MRFAIVGAGGVGGYFGGLLASHGEDVTFIARGAHLEAIRRDGLRVESVHGDFTVFPTKATDDTRTVGPVDVVLFATKTYQLEAAGQALHPLIGPHTAVIPLHNGVDAADRTAAIAGREHVLGGVCYVGSMVASPGVIRQQSPFRRIIAGELAGSAGAGQVTPRVQAIVDVLASAGVTAEGSSDIEAAAWTKFAFIGPLSGVGSVTRALAGEIQATGEARQMLQDAIREVTAVALAEGVAVPADLAEKTLAFCDNLPPGMTASMQRDILDGKPSELESIIGVMVRKGDAHEIAVPTFRFFYASLLPQEKRARVASG